MRNHALAVIKLLGRGQYVVEQPGVDAGHFLAARNITHTTAPNHLYPDLVSQRLAKAVLSGDPIPYSFAELVRMAAHCTQQEDNAAKVERQLRKSAAAMLLSERMDQRFEAIVTGAAHKGTWVRTLGSPTIDGRVVDGEHGMRVGDRAVVRLVSLSVEHGFIDFAHVP